MRYIIKNLRSSLTKNPAVSWLYILCTVVSVLAVLFSHGVYQNYETKIIREDSDVFPDVSISFGNTIDSRTTRNGNTVYFGDGTSTFGEFRSVLDMLDAEVKEGMGGFCVHFYTQSPQGLEEPYVQEEYKDKASVFVSMIYDKEADDFGYLKLRQLNSSLSYGRHITREEYLAGEHFVELPNYVNEIIEKPKDLIGTKIELLGQEYTVIGIYEDGSGDFDVPFSTVPDDAEFSSIDIYTDKPITTKVYKRFVAAMEEVYGDRVLLPDFPTVDEEEQTFYRSIMLISLVLSAIAAITLAILFRFIIYTRRKSLAVLRLSGCTRNGARIMYITEGIGITAALFLLTTLAYNKWILPHLTVFFDRITEVYTPATYVYIAAVFLGTLFVVLCAMVSFSVDKQPVDMLRKAGGR